MSLEDQMDMDFGLDATDLDDSQRTVGIKQYSYKVLKKSQNSVFRFMEENDIFGFELDKENLAYLASGLSDKLSAPYHAVWNTLYTYTGEQLTFDLALEISWRFAGNLSAVKKGLPINRYAGQAKMEWVFAEVWRAGYGPEDPVCRLVVEFLICTGSPAGHLIRTDYMAGTEVQMALKYGLDKTQAPAVRPRSFIGFHTYVKLVPREPGNPDLPRVAKTKCSEKQKGDNRRLTRVRWSPTGCPYGIKPTRLLTCMDCDHAMIDPIQPCPYAPKRRKKR
jgi:hypothetical protein